MPQVGPNKYLIQLGWDDAPHLTESAKRELWEGTEPHLRRARAYGEPAIGIGRIYPFEWAAVSCAPFEIPDHWPRCFALDPGWNITAAMWAAIDRQNDVIYCHGEYYAGQRSPSVHAIAINARGEWVPGVSDPAVQQSGQKDGEKLLHTYRAAKVNIRPCSKSKRNTREHGIAEVYQRLDSGRLKFFTTLGNTMFEFSIYHRDDKGRVEKVTDHLMDCVRYICTDGILVAKSKEQALSSGIESVNF